MRLELTVVLSCTGDWCEARYLDTGSFVRACRSAAMIEHDIRQFVPADDDRFQSHLETMPRLRPFFNDKLI